MILDLLTDLVMKRDLIVSRIPHEYVKQPSIFSLFNMYHKSVNELCNFN